MKTLTLIRLEDGTLIDNREHGRRSPLTPDEAEVEPYLIRESRFLYSITYAIEARLSDHRPFTTTSGRFGYGRESVEEGDVLCIFDGSTTAHLIRRKDNGHHGGEVFQLVGEAFVHGMMYGEIEQFGIEEQNITLI